MMVPCIQKEGDDSATADAPNTSFHVNELLRRCMGDHDLAAALIERFGARLGSTIQELERSLATDDRLRAVSVVHNLKGEAGNMGATPLQRDAAALEDCLRAERKGETGLCLGRLKSTAEKCLLARSGALKQLRHSD